MKLRNPINRDDLRLKKTYRIIEVGGGHNPHPRSNVVVDKYVDSNYHRSGDLKVYKNQQFLCADGENLPFEDKSFDYAICCQVIEHVEDPIKFSKEQARVAKAGYMETPSLIGEYLAPKESHKWVILEIDEKIVMYEKDKVGFTSSRDYGHLFLDYLPKQSLGYKLMQRTHSGMMSVNYEWKDDIDVLVNPDSSYYYDFFTKPWDDKTCKLFITNRSLSKELGSSVYAFMSICKSVFNSRVLKKV